MPGARQIAYEFLTKWLTSNPKSWVSRALEIRRLGRRSSNVETPNQPVLDVKNVTDDLVHDYIAL